MLYVYYLPFLFLLSKVFSHYGVDVEGEAFIAMQPQKKIGENSLHKMMMTKRNGQWMFKNEEQEQALGENVDPLQNADILTPENGEKQLSPLSLVLSRRWITFITIIRKERRARTRLWKRFIQSFKVLRESS